LVNCLGPSWLPEAARKFPKPFWVQEREDLEALRRR
jgi:hypothetical protein